LLFNGMDGEYLAEIKEISSKKIIFSLLKQTRVREEEVEINRIFAPIKQARINFLLEKATELGVTRFIPVETQHSVVDKINLTKWNIYLKEATEQCGRLSVPVIEEITKLDKFLLSWPEDRQIILCNETEKSFPLSQCLKMPKYNIMIGPEGGFSAQELLKLSEKRFITSVHLGKRILRAETAALVAVSYFSI
jgi:16S rRNA (uracil1498-N3)-methyltransferase